MLTRRQSTACCPSQHVRLSMRRRLPACEVQVVFRFSSPAGVIPSMRKYGGCDGFTRRYMKHFVDKDYMCRYYYAVAHRYPTKKRRKQDARCGTRESQVALPQPSAGPGIAACPLQRSFTSGPLAWLAALPRTSARQQGGCPERQVGLSGSASESKIPQTDSKHGKGRVLCHAANGPVSNCFIW